MSEQSSSEDEGYTPTPSTRTRTRTTSQEGKKPSRERKRVARYQAEDYEGSIEEERLVQQALKNSMKETRRVEFDIPNAPTMYPTAEEFKDPMKYIAS